MPFDFDNKPSLIAYVTRGDPDLATTRDIVLAAIDAGAFPHAWTRSRRSSLGSAWIDFPAFFRASRRS